MSLENIESHWDLAIMEIPSHQNTRPLAAKAMTHNDELKPYTFKVSHGHAYDIKHGSYPPDLFWSFVAKGNWDTHFFTYDLGHCFLPIYVNAYKNKHRNYELTQTPCITTPRRKLVAADALNIVKHPATKRFVATPTHSNNRDFKELSLTAQCTTIYDVLILAKSENLKIEGELIIPALYPNPTAADVHFWDFRTCVQKSLEFAAECKVITNVHPLCNVHNIERLTLDMAPNKRPFSYNILVTSLDSSSKYQWTSSLEEPFIYIQSPSRETSLDESLKLVGSATGKDLVGHIRVDVNTELSDLVFLEKIFIWANKAVMGTDVEVISTTCLIDRGDINSRASPAPKTFNRWDIEAPRDKVYEWAKMLQSTHPLKNASRPVLVFPILQDLSTTFAFHTKERREENGTVYELIEKLWKSPLMSECVLFVMPRTIDSLAVVLNTNAVPETGVPWDRHVFNLLDARGYTFSKAAGLQFLTRQPSTLDVAYNQTMSARSIKDEGKTNPNLACDSAPHHTTFLDIKSAAALFGELNSIKPFAGNTQVASWDTFEVRYKHPELAILTHQETITGMAFQHATPNLMRKEFLINPLVQRGMQRLKAILTKAKDFGSEKELQRTRTSLALPLTSEGTEPTPSGRLASAVNYVTSHFSPY